MANKYIYFFDVDDTVCPSAKPIGAPMAEELNRLIASGGVIGFISGATAAQMQGQLAGALLGVYHVLGTCGAQYLRVEGNQEKEIYHHTMDVEARKRVLAALHSLAARHGIKSMTTEEDQIQDRLSQVTFSAIGRHAPDGDKRAFDPEKNRRRAWALELGEELGPNFQITIGGTTSLDITPLGQDKGWGLREFFAYGKLQAENAVFFGDNLSPGGNDYPARTVIDDCIAVRNPQDTLEHLKKAQIQLP
jgi:phosphomannomutase